MTFPKIITPKNTTSLVTTTATTASSANNIAPNPVIVIFGRLIHFLFDIMYIHALNRVFKPVRMNTSMRKNKTIFIMIELNLIPILIGKNTINSIIFLNGIPRAVINILKRTVGVLNVVQIRIINIMVSH